MNAPKSLGPAAVALFVGLAAIATFVWKSPGWWTRDDLALLDLVGRHGIADYLNSITFWREEVPWRVYSPVQFLLYEADLNLWGHAAEKFYVHNVLWLAGAVSLSTLVVAKLESGRAGLVFGALSLSSSPFLVAGNQLMNRHYFTGLVFLALAVLFADRSLKQEVLGLNLFVSSGLFFLACLSKEVWALAFLPIAFLPGASSVPRRLQLAGSWACSFVLYFILRAAMLGDLVGGTAFLLPPGKWAGAVPELVDHLAISVFGNTLALAGKLVSAAFVLVLIWRLRREGSTSCLLLLATVLCAALTPLLPTAPVLTHRHAVPAVLVVAFLVASSLTAIEGPSWLERALAAAVGGCLVAGTLTAGMSELRFLKRYATEGRFAMDCRDCTIRHPVAETHYLSRISETRADKATRLRWFQDDYYLCIHAPSTLPPIYQYRGGSLAALDPSYVKTSADSYCEGYVERDLGELLTRTPLGIRWSLPRSGGSWELLIDDGVSKVPLPPSGEYRGALPGNLRLKHVRPDGRVEIDLPFGPVPRRTGPTPSRPPERPGSSAFSGDRSDARARSPFR